LPQIDNVAFFSQVLSSFFIVVLFLSLTLKVYGLIVASTLKIRANLFFLVTSDLTFKKILDFIYTNYSYQYIYTLNKANLQVSNFFNP
jgi:hypothetical protein